MGRRIWQSAGRGQKRLRVIVPVTILLIGILLYINFASLTDTLLGVAVIPMAMIGGVFALLLTGRAGARRHQLGGSDRRRYRSAAVSRNPCVLSFRSRKVGSQHAAYHDLSDSLGTAINRRNSCLEEHR